MTATEYVILVDENDQEIGTAEKMVAHQNNLLHRAFSVFIFRNNPSLELLIQQRALHKYHSAGLWTNTCCSHPRSGEGILEAGERRLKEELGLTTSLKKVGQFHYNAHFSNHLHENELDHVLVGFVSPTVQIDPNPEEIQDYRWVGLEELETELASQPGKFTPWFEQALGIALNP